MTDISPQQTYIYVPSSSFTFAALIVTFKRSSSVLFFVAFLRKTVLSAKTFKIVHESHIFTIHKMPRFSHTHTRTHAHTQSLKIKHCRYCYKGTTKADVLIFYLIGLFINKMTFHKFTTSVWSKSVQQ